MRFASALSTLSDAQAAVAEASRQAREALGATADLAVVFVSPLLGPDLAMIAAEVRRLTGTRHLIGATGESIVGVGREIEGAPALSVWLASLPGVTIRPMHLRFERSPDGGRFVGWPDDLPLEWPKGSAMLCLGEPFTFPADVLLERLGQDQPGVPVMGGMASGAHAPGENFVLLDDQALDNGAAAVLLDGPFELRAVVSQGCRPIGRPMVITKAQQQVIAELGGKPALAALGDALDTLGDQPMPPSNALHLGRVINEYQEKFDRGDFLVRNLIGADRESGAIAVGDFVRTGQTVQFHIRDAAAADEELRAMLTQVRSSGAAPAGALLFTCNGRGTRLFDVPDHDAAAVAEVLGPLPLAGFFAQGEIGPVGGKNFVHGFTASLALFCPKSESK
jgi:small ligand-binding sensory domain FIST